MLSLFSSIKVCSHVGLISGDVTAGEAAAGLSVKAFL